MNNEVKIRKKNLDVDAEGIKLQALVKEIIQQAKIKGASQAEVGAASDTGFSINVRLGEVDTIEYQSDKSIGISVYFGKRKGSASTSDISQEAIEQTLQAACDIAKYTSEDPYNGLADKELMAFNYPSIDAYYPWDIDTDQAIELAKRCESQGFKVDNRIKNSEGVSVATSAGVHVYGNSHGFIGTLPMTRHSISCVLVAEAAGTKQRDCEYTIARDPLSLTSIEKIAAAAAKKTVNRLGAKSISTRNTPVVFSADLAKGIIGCLVAAVSGGNLYRKSSFLLDSLGQTVLPKWLTIIEKPLVKKTLGSAPYDAEGVATKEQTLVEQGTLMRYVLGSYSARKLGLKTTGNAGGVNNLVVSHKDLSFEDLLKNMGTGFLVTELIGHGVNIVTGTYSRGGAGYWIENGKISHPVEEVTIAGNLKEMLLNIEDIAGDVDDRGNIQCGSMLIKNMQLAGK